MVDQESFAHTPPLLAVSLAGARMDHLCCELLVRKPAVRVAGADHPQFVTCCAITAGNLGLQLGQHKQYDLCHRLLLRSLTFVYAWHAVSGPDLAVQCRP